MFLSSEQGNPDQAQGERGQTKGSQAFQWEPSQTQAEPGPGICVVPFGSLGLKALLSEK